MLCSLPYLPGRVAAIPEVVQDLAFAKRIHGLKETVVVIGDKLEIGGQALERFFLEHALIAIEIIEHLALEYKEPGTGPGVRLGFLYEVQHLVGLVNVEDAKSRNRAKSGHRGEPAMVPVERQQPRDIDVAHTISVSQHKTIIGNVLLGA